MSDDDELVADMVPFPFVYREIRTPGEVKLETRCPVNEMLTMAIKGRMPELAALGMVCFESQKRFPSYAVMLTNSFHFEREAVVLGRWIEETLRVRPPETGTLYFSHQVDEAQGDDSRDTYSIALLSSDPDNDDDYDLSTEVRFESPALDALYALDAKLAEDFLEIENSFKREFLDKIVLYAYGVLLVVKACRTIDFATKFLGSGEIQKVVYRVSTESEWEPWLALDLGDLL